MTKNKPEPPSISRSPGTLRFRALSFFGFFGFARVSRNKFVRADPLRMTYYAVPDPSHVKLRRSLNVIYDYSPKKFVPAWRKLTVIDGSCVKPASTLHQNWIRPRGGGIQLRTRPYLAQPKLGAFQIHPWTSINRVDSHGLFRDRQYFRTRDDNRISLPWVALNHLAITTEADLTSSI